MDHSWYFCLVLLCFHARLFVDALWSPGGKGLTSWLSFVMSYCDIASFPLVFLVRCSAWLYRFLIFALFLTLVTYSLKVNRRAFNHQSCSGSVLIIISRFPTRLIWYVFLSRFDSILVWHFLSLPFVLYRSKAAKISIFNVSRSKVEWTMKMLNTFQLISLQDYPAFIISFKCFVNFYNNWFCFNIS